jgi:hypothetical protein
MGPMVGAGGGGLGCVLRRRTRWRRLRGGGRGRSRGGALWVWLLGWWGFGAIALVCVVRSGSSLEAEKLELGLG